MINNCIAAAYCSRTPAGDAWGGRGTSDAAARRVAPQVANDASVSSSGSQCAWPFLYLQQFILLWNVSPLPLPNINIAFHPKPTPFCAWGNIYTYSKYLKAPLSCFPLIQSSFAQAFCPHKGASFWYTSSGSIWQDSAPLFSHNYLQIRFLYMEIWMW